jgi:hypothetical protein
MLSPTWLTTQHRAQPSTSPLRGIVRAGFTGCSAACPRILTACLSDSITPSLTLTICRGLARFWTQALGLEGSLGAGARDRHRDGQKRARRNVLHAGHRSPTVKNRAHLDLTSSAQDRGQEIELLLALGGAPGRHRADGRRALDGAGRPRGKRVLCDTPEGNAHPVTSASVRTDRRCPRHVRAVRYRTVRNNYCNPARSGGVDGSSWNDSCAGK